jgi:hypothetical protein
MKKKFFIFLIILLLAVFGSLAIAGEKIAKLTISDCGA